MIDPEEQKPTTSADDDAARETPETVASGATTQADAEAAKETAPADVPVPAMMDAAAAKAAEDDPERRRQETEAADAEVLASSRRHTRRSFVLAAAGAAAGYGFYQYLSNAPGKEMQPGPLRNAFLWNADLSRNVLRDTALAPTYPLDRAEDLRVNGIYGLKEQLMPESWRMQLVGARDAEGHPRFTKDVTAWTYEYVKGDSKEDAGHDTKVDPNLESAAKMAPEAMMAKAQEDENHTGRKPRGFEESGESKSTLPPGTPGLLLTIDDVMKLPRHELVTQFKCIEGWSQIVHWAGVRMADFIEAYPPAQIDGREPLYVYMETPNGDYYVGYDMQVMRHPQTLLVTEMMGAPLTQFHGAPLRMHLPTKYGYKQIKRIGLIAYTNNKPDDYWTKLGYDWYGGL